IKTISVNTTTVSNVWFAIAPVDVGALEITINTDKGTFSKKITPDRSFQSGHIALINVDMSGVDIESPKTYKRAESLADLVVGSKVIVAAQDANYAISTTQNTNNRAQASVTKNEDGSLILTPAANVEIFQLENGSASGTFALRALGEDAPGYIWAAGGTGSSNYLKTTSTLSLASSWNISFTEGVISVVSADANVKRNTLRYNAGSSIFSCYATGSQSAIALYVSEDEAPVDVKTFIVSPLTLNVAADATNATIEVVSNVDWTVTFPAGVSGSLASGNGNATIALSFAANTDTQAKSYEIVVATANADVATQRYTVTLNQAAAAAGTTTIAEVLEACSTLAEGSVSEEIFEVQNATVMAAYKAYAVLDDGTGTIIAYKSNHGFVAGDILTVSGYVKNYYKLLEFTNANSVNVTMTKTGDAPTIIYPKPLELTATELDAYATEAIKPVDYVAATGLLDGYVITLEGIDIKVSLQGIVAAYNGKEVEVMGYAAGYNASSKKMTVILTEIQEIAGSATLTVNPTSLSFGANGGETEITVDSDNANWTVSSTESWLSFQKGTNSVVVTAAANTDAARTGTITFTHATESTLTATVTVSQSAPAPAGSWELVTNAADLMDGDIVTFYAHETYKVSGQSYEAWHAVGHYNGTFFGYVAVNANEDDTYFTSEDAVYTFTLNGSAANGWTLSGEDGYLYVKEKNKVSCQETATTWTIAIDSETGKVACEQVLEADGNTYRMQWNSNSGNARFSAYAATQKDPKLFRLNKK
ncbi:MAG: BACON domain-containing protein, partial [Bacteroidales bacterium]|nr:BACON domain-containing protein [Bacteroidales bacterium]